MKSKQTTTTSKEKKSAEWGTSSKHFSNKIKHSLKVVYISSPMKITTSAADFRALVQGLTGQDADWPADPSKLKIPAAGTGSDLLSDNQIPSGKSTIYSDLSYSDYGEEVVNYSSVFPGGLSGVLAGEAVPPTAGEISSSSTAPYLSGFLQPIDHRCGGGDDDLVVPIDDPNNLHDDQMILMISPA